MKTNLKTAASLTMLALGMLMPMTLSAGVVLNSNSGSHTNRNSCPVVDRDDETLFVNSPAGEILSIEIAGTLYLTSGKEVAISVAGLKGPQLIVVHTTEGTYEGVIEL